MYPGAQGNIRFGGKRFWTDCLYPYIQTDYGQAGWMKEEPPVIYAGECQSSLLIKNVIDCDLPKVLAASDTIWVKRT